MEGVRKNIEMRFSKILDGSMIIDRNRGMHWFPDQEVVSIDLSKHKFTRFLLNWLSPIRDIFRSLPLNNKIGLSTIREFIYDL
jgi:hypothetical protein